MKLTIQRPQYLYEAGNKSENEDFIFPIEGKADSSSRLFIVCDGDSGSSNSKTDHGGIASQLLAMTIASQFSNLVKTGDADQDLIQKIVRYANDSLGKYLVKHPASEGIGASFSLLHLGESKVTVAWLGNSRVYYFNKTLKSVHSSDQWEENMEDPAPDALLTGLNSEIRVRTRYFTYEDLMPGDCFFLASSGMDQEVHVSSLKSVFTAANESGPEAIMDEISNLIVSGLAGENYSSYLIPIGEAKHKKQPEISERTSDASDSDSMPLVSAPVDSGLAGRKIGWLVGGVFTVILSLLLVVAYLEQQDKPFNNMLTEGDLHLQALKEANTTIGFAGSEEEALAARAAYDSALIIASTEEERRLILTRQSELEALLDTRPVTAIDLIDIPISDLNQSPAQYIKDGKQFFEAGNYPEALQAFWNAERKLKQKPTENLMLPAEEIAESYIRIASAMFASTHRDCELINEYYHKAFGYYTPAESPEWYRNAQENAETCVAVMASANTESSSADSTSAPQAISASEAIAAVTGESISANQADNPASTRGMLSRRSEDVPTSASARFRSLGSPEASEETMIELKRLLSEGKRQYIEAKTQNSAFLYATSANKLERSAQALDGPGAYLLAYMNHAGLGVDRDEQKALRYAQISARKKWAAGEYLYGHLLLERQNKRDSITAVSSLQMSANQMYSDAIKRLSELGIQLQ